MLYRQKFDTFIRIYEDIGYITNRSNFSDRVMDASGAIFLKYLSRNPKPLSQIAAEIANEFIDIDNDILEKDIIDFYSMLEDDGFIISGDSEAELNKKDKHFSYSDIEVKTIKTDFTPVTRRAERNTQHFLEEYFKHRPQLNSLQIELTSRCNERCVHCYIPHENKIKDIEPGLFYDILEQCKEMNILSLTLSGGEPLLHKYFLDFLAKAKNYDFSINILSNLTLLNNEIIAEMKANRLSSVQVSLYSMTPEIHDSITQVNGSFNKTKDSILKLIDNDIPLQISCPTMKQNKDSFFNVFEWSQQHKVRTITDYIMMARYDYTTDNLNNRLNIDEVEEVINKIIENDTEYQKELINADIGLLEQTDISNDILCGVCISCLCMVSNGNVYPCPGWQNYVLGNVKENTLREIWENSSKVKYLRNLRKKDFPKCLTCIDRGFCAMCMVRNANENLQGDPMKINEHFCKVAAVNRKIVMDWKERNINCIS